MSSRVNCGCAWNTPCTACSACNGPFSQAATASPAAEAWRSKAVRSRCSSQRATASVAASQQRRHQQQRRGHRGAARCPGAARLADQGQHGRRGDQHPQRIADPPGPPGEGQRRRGYCRGQAECRGGNRRIDQAGHWRGQQQETPDVTRLRQRQRLGHEAPHQRAADGSLQGGADPDSQRHPQCRQVDLPASRAQPQVDANGAQRHRTQCGTAIDPGCGQRDAGRRVQRRRIARREGQAQGQPTGQGIGQCGQAQHPRPRNFGVVFHRWLGATGTPHTAEQA